MREGLRSNTRLKREREMIDLNKEPIESKMPSSDSPSSVDYLSAGDHMKDVDSGGSRDVAGNADADDGGKGEGEERKEEKDSKTDFEGAVGKAEAQFPSTNAGLVAKDVNASETIGCGNSGADVGVNAGAGEIGEAVGKKRRGRKRKVVESGVSCDRGVGLESLNKEQNAKLAKIGEDGSMHGVLENGQDANVGGEVAADGGANTGEGRQEGNKGRRGRKRKILGNSGEDVGKGVEKLAVADKPQIVGRVLRSRTMAVTDGEKQAYREGNAGVGDQEVELEGDQSAKISKADIDESARPAHRGTKILKGRRGRPPKMHGKNGNSMVTVGHKVKTGSRRNIKLPRAKVMKGSKVQEQKKKVASDLSKGHEKKSNHNNEGEMGRNEEKQLLRIQIMNIIKEAGWTIEYRPRMNREYCDAVYVDQQGRTYWSVTLAYKKLKQMIEDGTADAKAVSAFILIPEDELSKLYRISKEKGNKSKKSKLGKRLDKTFTARSTGVTKSKADLNAKPHLGEKSCRKKKVDSSEQENTVASSGRIKPKSRREGGRKPFALLARCPDNDHDANGFKMYKGALSLLSWMIDWGTVSLGGKVQYMSHDRTALMLVGKITREGISCGCCGKVVTYVDFESHAGSTLRQPYENIFLESGHSLLQCMRETWCKQEETDNIGFHYVDVDGDDGDDPHDDTCNICADGGNLTCCDGCPSTFHHSCLQMQDSPDGYWRCVHCSCKFCGTLCGKATPSDNIPDIDHYTGDCESFTCYFCEEKFHVHCRLEKDDVDIHSEDLSFCGRGCQKLFEHLQKLLGVRHELEAGYSWTILRHQDLSMDVSCSADSSEVVCNSKLAIAFSIMDECFEPFIDERSNINLIQSVIYSCGSNFRRLNCRRFYTFILERGDELVSAAAVRVHGNQLAEMPFIGTRSIYRRQGMCRRLLTAIEMALSSLNVEKLVIPAVSELRETWTRVFGFLPLEESKRQEMKYMSVIAFPGTDMLQKPLCKGQVTERQRSATGMELFKLTIEHVKGGTPPARNVDASSADKLQENVEAAAAAVGSSGNITNGCFNDERGITDGVEFTISSNDKTRHDFGGALELCKGFDTEENIWDKLVFLTFTSAARKTSSDSNNDISLICLSLDSLPSWPQPCLKSSNQSGNTLCNSELVCSATAQAEVARL